MQTYSQTCVQRPLKKVAIVQNWLLFRRRSLKITKNIKKLGITLAVVDRWALFRGGRCSEVAVNTGLTVVACLDSNKNA
jgi:hypothetical protein